MDCLRRAGAASFSDPAPPPDRGRWHDTRQYCHLVESIKGAVGIAVAALAEMTEHRRSST